jgi:hypothetical protein
MSKTSARRTIWRSAAAQRMLGIAGSATSVEEAVVTVANRLLEGIACPPTDLDAIMPRLNVTSCTAVEGFPISGELRSDDGKTFSILYAASLPRERRRFTIAHEFGHAVLETSGRNCPRYGKELERICDMFASELLMPRQLFADVAAGRPGPDRILDLAKSFQCSLMATALKCVKLFGLSVFQVENGKVKWGYGAIRSQSDLARDRDELDGALREAMAGISGESVLNLRGPTKVRWTSLGRSGRALFVLATPRRALPAFRAK